MLYGLPKTDGELLKVVSIQPLVKEVGKWVYQWSAMEHLDLNRDARPMKMRFGLAVNHSQLS